jgi:hypothetical protein
MSLPQARSVRLPNTLPWLPLGYGAVFVAALVVLVIAVTNQVSGTKDVFSLTITDPDGRPIEEARVVYGEALYLSDIDGEVRLEVPDDALKITVEYEGFKTMVGEFGASHAREQTLTLQPQGQAEDALPSGSQPVPAMAATAEASPAETALAVTPGEVAGKLLTPDGNPIARGWVTDGTSYAFTDAGGVFYFAPGTIPAGATLTAFGPGHETLQMPVPTDGKPLELTLDVQHIRGIYFNPGISYNQEDIDRFIRIANTTEINAVVIDIKEEVVFYGTSVQLFNDAGIVNPIMDLPALLQQFKDNGIYTIARLVVFKDSLIAEQFPDLAVLDNQTGGLWRDMNGVAWVNPMDHTLWDANIDLAYEAATMGFDEIQYDYIRFPTDGDLSRVSYGLENSQENRENAIEKFLQRSHERLVPTGVKTSADIFGYTVMVQDDLGIGQNMDQLADHVDYISPMVYPSHWPEGSIAVNGHPNDFPYETIEISMGLAKQQLNGSGAQLRPWLQDFNYWIEGSRDYGDAEVRAQIDASEDLGLSGWLIWDPNNRYHEGAFLPETSEQPVTQPATPAVGTPAATSRPRVRHTTA